MTKQAADDLIDEQIARNDVVLLMKGTRQFPQRGFSAAVPDVLQALGRTGVCA